MLRARGSIADVLMRRLDEIERRVAVIYVETEEREDIAILRDSVLALSDVVRFVTEFYVAQR